MRKLFCAVRTCNTVRRWLTRRGGRGCAAVQAKPPRISMHAAREEAELVMFTSIKEVLDACGLEPRQVPPSAKRASLCLSPPHRRRPWARAA